jgi:hypothetical protein
MKLKTFVYTDLKGKISNRQVLVVQEPTTKLSGIDVTEQDDEAVVNFALAYEAARSTFLAQVEALQRQYDLNHRYRQFFEDKMDGVVTEEI